MVNFSTIISDNSKIIEDAKSALHKISNRSGYQKDGIETPSRWSDIEVEKISDIIKIRGTLSGLEAEQNRVNNAGEFLREAGEKLNDLIRLSNQFINDSRAHEIYNNFSGPINISALKRLANNLLKEITNICNSKHTDGSYIFSGDASYVKPFQDDSMSYKGGYGQRSLFGYENDQVKMIIKGDSPEISGIIKNLKNFSTGDSADYDQYINNINKHVETINSQYSKEIGFLLQYTEAHSGRLEYEKNEISRAHQGVYAKDSAILNREVVLHYERCMSALKFHASIRELMKKDLG